MMGLAHRGFALNDYQRHIVHRLHPAGYHSALCGVQHIAKKPAVIGYREIIPARNNRAEAVAPAAVEWLRNAPRRPFFLDVGFFETHREFHPPGPHENARYTLPPAPIPDTPRSRQDMAAFHASARVLDDAIGAVFSALDASGLAENTLVICTTDHGIPFPGMKCNLTDHGTGVMLMLRGPGGFTGGKVVDAMVSHLDLYPTICDLAGVDHPSWLQGKSLLPLIRGEQQELHEQLFAEVTYHAAYEPKRAVRTKRWKYIRNFGDRRNPVLPNCDDGLSKDVWLESGWKQRIVDREQLYDLTFDPNETRNMAGDASSAAVLEDMRARLNRWMVETHDPLLKGPVPLPAGAVANDPAGTSPKEI
jgi:Arylsulfatase A and related enzymes